MVILSDYDKKRLADIFKWAPSLSEARIRVNEFLQEDNPGFDKERFKRASTPNDFKDKVAGCKNLEKQINELSNRGDVRARVSGSFSTPPHLEELVGVQRQFILKKCSNYLE